MLKGWPQVWLLVPALEHFAVYAIWCVGRSVHSVAPLDLFKYCFVVHACHVKDITNVLISCVADGKVDRFRNM